MSTELISILITTYNRSHCLSELLARLTAIYSAELEQGTAEILVFNDASTDDTAQVCATYRESIHYLSIPQNVGCIEGRRRLIAAAQGAYLVSLDDDSIFLDGDALDQIRAAFARYPECGVLAANIASPRSPGGQAPVDLEPMNVGRFVGCGHVLRAESVRCTGGYLDFLSGYGAEETVLSLRLLNQGYQIKFLPSLRVYHAVDPAERPLVRQRAQAFVNELAIVVYAYPWWLIGPTIVKKTTSRVLFDARHQSLRAVGLAVKKLPRAFRRAVMHRQAIQFQTLRQFVSLNQVFASQSKKWHANGLIPDHWSDIEGIFNT